MDLKVVNEMLEDYSDRKEATAAHRSGEWRLHKFSQTLKCSQGRAL